MRGDRGHATVVVPLPPSYRGGTEEYAYRVIAQLAQRTRVHAWTTTVRWDPSVEPIETTPAQLERLPAVEVCERPLLLSPWARHALFRDLRHAEVAHLHMPFPAVEAPFVRAARRRHLPVVLTYHMDADLAGVRASRAARAMTWTYRRTSAHPALEACDTVVSNSWGYAKASPVLSRHLHRVRVIPKGVDPARLGISATSRPRPRPACVPASQVPEGRRRLLFVGRLVPYKGVPLLVDAVHDLVRDGQDVGLLLAGRGPLLGALKAQVARLGLEERVTFLGFVPDAQLGPLYRYSDLVVVPSLTPLEATATTLEEAIASGTPVVGTLLPGTDETVPNDGRRGRLVPPGELTALRHALSEMAERDHFAPPDPPRTWQDVARDYWELYRDLGARLPPFESSSHSTPLAWTMLPAPTPARRLPGPLTFPHSPTTDGGRQMRGGP